MVDTDAVFSPDTVVNTMLESKTKWEAICEFIDHVLKTREEEERQRQLNGIPIVLELNVS